MKKSTKLLSVILAVLMIFSSLSVASFAARTNYKTAEDLTALNAYNQYGSVTRLSTEERMSILFDQLDILLGELNIKMDPIKIMSGLVINIDLRSVDGICSTIDSLYNLRHHWLWPGASLMVGVLSKLVVNASATEWNDYGKTGKGTPIRRDNYSQVEILTRILNVLSSNTELVNAVLTKGLDLGIIKSFLKGVDLDPINAIVTDLPKTVRTIVLPHLARPDTPASELANFVPKAGSGELLSVLESFVPTLFTKPMLWTSYRVDATGKDLGYTATLPTAIEGTSRYFVVSEDGTSITQYDYNFTPLMGADENTGKWTQTVTYTKALETEGGDTYVFKAPEGYTGDQTLKWYKNGDKGYLLPSVRDAINDKKLTISVTGTDSALGLLYKFIPYVFAEMAPVVLNGSVKKLLAGALGVEFAEMTADEVNAVKDLPAADDFFTKPQEFYLWEYSDYKVIDDVPYYRFEDTYFKGTLPENLSTYYYMFNWDWKITDDFVNAFIPTVNGTTIGKSEAGYDSILDGLNAFVYKVIDTVLVPSFEVNGKKYDLRAGLGWENGGLDKVVNNVLRAARYAFSIAPEEIFDEYYSDAKLSPYYNMMMNGTVKQALTGLACAGIKLLMPQAQLPSEAKLCNTVGTDSADDVSVLALGSVVLRELCTQFMPQYNFDALIYADYSTKTILTGTKYDANYWLDTALTIGMDFGMYYLRNLTDIGEDSENGYYKVMKKLGAIPSDEASALVYAADSTYKDGVPTWQIKLDWVIDWGLSSQEEWTWSFKNLVDCGDTVDLATYQNPWKKLNTILLKILPFNQVLDGTGVTTESNTWLENVLRGKLVNGICTLDLPLVASAFKIPDGILRNGNVLTQVVTVVRELLNSVLFELAGKYTFLAANTYSDVDAILNQANLRSFIVDLLGKLSKIVTNALDPALPIVGMFLGWKTSVQEYKDPSIYITTSKNDVYLHSGATNTLKFTNKSSGMIEKHRNSNTIDKAYVIEVKGISSEEGITVQGTFPKSVQPGETLDVGLTVAQGAEKVVKLVVSYSYIGKDGNPIGGEQTKAIYARITSTWDQEDEKVTPAAVKDGVYGDEFNKYIFTTDLYNSVVGTVGSMLNNNGKSRKFGSIKAGAQQPNALFKKYFVAHTNRTESEWPATIDARTGSLIGGYSPSVASGRLYKANAGVSSKTDFPIGMYDGGEVDVQYGNGIGKFTIDYYYYKDFDISKVVKSYIDKNLQASNYGAEAATAFAEYETALRDAKFLADTPKTTTYLDTAKQFEAAVNTLNEKYEALMKFTPVTKSADVNSINEAINAIAEAKGYEIDYENYELYEFFAYDKAVKAGYKMIDSTKGPAKPENYIEGENLSQAVIEAIANANSGNIKTGIDATVSAPSEEAMTKYNDALANFTAPVYSELQVSDTISRINYYFIFMDANMKAKDVKTFLNQEIDIAKAQNYVQGDYSTDSWAAYTKALADAEAIAATTGARPSQIFDAKYELMKAQNDLLPKKYSMKDNGYLDGELSALIEQANTIVGHFNEYFKVKDGVDATEAWKQLVQALGVEYNVTVDDVEYSGILYNNSALTFKAYDRLNTNKEKAKVDAACSKLRAALNNFVSSVTLDKNNSGVVNQVTQDVRYIQGIVPGTVTTADAILNNVKASNPAATLAVTPSKSNGYGTGATVKVSVDGIGVLSTYYVVVYGDVNGDGVVDAFDAFAVDKNVNSLAALDGVYAKAADADASGKITVADLTPIMSAAVGNANVISQTR